MWIKGRQNTGYFKKTFYSFSIFGIGFDCHLIKYPLGSHIPPHTDTLKDKVHRRLNFIIKTAAKGGIFKKNGVEKHGRIHFFRPDVDTHGVTPIDKGERIVLSFGIAYKKDNYENICTK